MTFRAVTDAPSTFTVRGIAAPVDAMDPDRRLPPQAPRASSISPNGYPAAVAPSAGKWARTSTLRASTAARSPG